MSDSDALETSDWSSLNTVSDFDLGLGSTSRQDVIPLNDVKKSTVNSLFVESLIDQLCKLLVKDSAEQRRLYEVLCSKLFEMHLVGETYRVEELASLRGHYQQALVSLTTASPHNDPCFQAEPLELSRYHTEYEELEYIASGGFGKVFKARHHLDGAMYAVKKIPLRNRNLSTFRKRIKEVKTLARLNHPNIVQYKGAWLEPLIAQTTSTHEQDVSVMTDSSTGSDDGVVFKNSQQVSVSHSKSTADNKVNLTVCQYQANTSCLRQVGALLHVSMQLCDGTLHQWLDNRNSFPDPVVNVPLVLRIFLQVTLGLEYIHSCGVVHHDIKPSNIFLSSDLTSVQLGDFGLSCWLHGHSQSEPCPLEDGQTGTLLYAAPEQLKGFCTPKSDMFSLGLVLVELLTPFATTMERVAVLNKMKSGFPPRTIPFHLVSIVKDLTSADPADRPSAIELVAKLKRMDMSTAATPRIVQVKDEEKEDGNEDNKDEEIAQLRKLLAEREDEIAELKRRLSES